MGPGSGAHNGTQVAQLSQTMDQDVMRERSKMMNSIYSGLGVAQLSRVDVEPVVFMDRALAMKASSIFVLCTHHDTKIRRKNKIFRLNGL